MKKNLLGYSEVEYKKFNKYAWYTLLSFSLLYVFGHLFNGRLSEIFGTKRFIIIGVLLTVVANLLISFQTSFLIIAILWGFNGYFQSMIWTPGLALIAKWWPSHKRGFANGSRYDS